MATVRRIVAGIGWLAAVLLIAFGAAGLAAAMDPPPSGDDRSELTATGDAEVTVALDAIEIDYEALAATIDALGIQARGALAALTADDLDTVDTAIAAGDGLLIDIKARTSAIAGALDGVPVLNTPTGAYRVSAGVRERYERLEAALGSTSGLDLAWARLTTSSVAAIRMSELLAAHDAAVLDAAALGRRAKYADAIKALRPATAALDDAGELRDRLANTVDVSTLDQWLDRNEAYDVALAELYRALRDVGGRVTKDVRDAIAAEKAAKDRLPPDNRGLILIMSDIARGGMNGAVIAIEETKGRLGEALEEPEPSPEPSSEPDAERSPEPTVAPN